MDNSMLPYYLIPSYHNLIIKLINIPKYDKNFVPGIVCIYNTGHKIIIFIIFYDIFRTTTIVVNYFGHFFQCCPPLQSSPGHCS